MLKAFKYRFYPTLEQETVLRRTIGCGRYVWNRALHLRSEAWKNGQNRIPGKDLMARLPEWKKDPDTEWLAEPSSVALQQKLNDLEVAYANFFQKKARYPSFKKKGSGGSFRLVGTAFRLREGRLYIAKCVESLDIRWSRSLPEGVCPSSVTISLRPDQKWYVSILVDDPRVQPLAPVDKQVGLDMGITALVTTSDGEKVTNSRPYKKARNRLAKLQRRLSRKKPGSKNYRKARVKVARVHQRISNIRHDQLHKLSTQLVRENQVIAIEDLSVRNMMKNHCLAGSISDSGWGILRSMLEYKCKWYGRELLVVDRWFPSSKTCSHCGYVLDRLTLSDREWTCPSCSTVHDRDENAATNILAAGKVVTACGGDVRPKGLRAWRQPPVKQAPVQVTGGIPWL